MSEQNHEQNVDDGGLAIGGNEATEVRRDSFTFHVTTPLNQEYTITAHLENAEVQEILISDRDSTVILPAGVIEQLVSAVGTQEQLVRSQFAHRQARLYGNNLRGMTPVQDGIYF